MYETAMNASFLLKERLLPTTNVNEDAMTRCFSFHGIEIKEQSFILSKGNVMHDTGEITKINVM